MNKNSQKKAKRQLRRNRVRSVVSGTTARPRLSVFRSAAHIYAQLIDDATGKTLASASSKDLKTKAAKTDQSGEVGKALAAKAKEKGIVKVVFDRGGYQYHGRVKALAEGAREAGLEF
jgi:large subunit ribosomal protein L18